MAELTLGATYQMYAKIAADMAAETSDPGHRTSLLEMAQAWRRLADKAEGAPHIIQQQQQSQPDDSKDKDV